MRVEVGGRYATPAQPRAPMSHRPRLFVVHGVRRPSVGLAGDLEAQPHAVREATDRRFGPPAMGRRQDPVSPVILDSAAATMPWPRGPRAPRIMQRLPVLHDGSSASIATGSIIAISYEPATPPRACAACGLVGCLRPSSLEARSVVHPAAHSRSFASVAPSQLGHRFASSAIAQLSCSSLLHACGRLVHMAPRPTAGSFLAIS